MLTTPFPEPESPELERYTVYSRAEIVAMMRQLREDRILVTVYHDAPQGGCVVTPVVAVKPEFEELICEAPGHAQAMAGLVRSERLVFVAFVDQVKLQWETRGAEAIVHDERPAFRVRLPEQILRLQRRDFFRVRTPADRPATCLVPWDEQSRQYESLRVIDISVGGAALLDGPEKAVWPEQGTIENCFLDLPGVGSFHVNLRVRHVDTRPGSEGKRSCGCEFVDMAPQARNMLQRYVNRLDAEQRRAQEFAPEALVPRAPAPGSLREALGPGVLQTRSA